jgi:hypothetical protein
MGIVRVGRRAMREIPRRLHIHDWDNGLLNCGGIVSKQNVTAHFDYRDYRQPAGSLKRITRQAENTWKMAGSLSSYYIVSDDGKEIKISSCDGKFVTRLSLS